MVFGMSIDLSYDGNYLVVGAVYGVQHLMVKFILITGMELIG